MFTGIVEEIGKIKNIKSGKVWKLEVELDKNSFDFGEGDSVAVNGVCLTVIEIKNTTVCFEIISETVSNTNISNLQKGSLVNLERSLKINENLSGHLVTGHVDGTGEIMNFKNKSGAQMDMEISTLPELMKYIVSKGSICVDGVSLTVNKVEENIFGVSLAPFTLNNTTLGSKQEGEKVNIEIDLIARYVFNFLTHKDKKGLDKETLKKYGFM